MKKKHVAWAALVSMVAGGGALLWLAVRPCEPVAQASAGPSVLYMPEQTIVSDPLPPEMSVEDLPKVRQVSAKPMAHISAKKLAHAADPEGVCAWREMLQGPIGKRVWSCQ
jgi:hypothetical protein